ncbi:MAG: hypothetical protein ACTSYD_10785 [Candidatus Heimdallarchaeaceae archaeon]
MPKYKFEVLFHPSITGHSYSIETVVDKGTKISIALFNTIRKDQKLFDRIFKDKEVKAGYLILKGKEELRSTHQLENFIEEDLVIRIVPISHGGN